MDVEKVKELKFELEDQLLDLIVKFENSTGCRISKVNTHYYFLSREDREKTEGLEIVCEVP